ncbi:Pr6Pr family membrane protein [Tabrizicola sp.]|uniref:Pr6Pr family membrane protein n=1 Tax=Tabrizicola sp. TaxID=2005166 RepID=UPI002734A604|nr:Pr6Pr family membrane protein [Tabrizicola sp.]MDP3649837.1 Pr6Pr family membrane protein [Paracoccaceae bacterium]
MQSRQPSFSPAARLLALGVSGVALVALLAQFRVSQRLLGEAPAGHALWLMAGYFTILTNLGASFLMAGVAAGLRPGARAFAALVVAIVMVALVYHLVLARLWQPQGLAWWADQGLHSAVPLLTLGWWLAFAQGGLTRRDLPALLIWPAAYAAYALLRGHLTGFWPYPFLDADALGWLRVAVNTGGLVAGFALLGTGLIALSRRSVR